jgi:hypothetical protein
MKRLLLLSFCLLQLQSACRAEEVYKTPIRLTPYNLIFTDVKVNGKSVVALIDTGSFRSVQISSTLAQELKIPLTETKITMKRYGGKSMALKQGVVQKFAIGRWHKEIVPVDVSEGDVENISQQVHTDFQVILGWGFVSKFQTLLDYKNLTLSFSAKPFDHDKAMLEFDFTVVGNVPVVMGKLDGKETNFLLDTGAPVSNLDIDTFKLFTGEKTEHKVELGESSFPLEFRGWDLSVIRKTLKCQAVLGTNFLSKYRIFIDPVRFKLSFD